MAGQARRLHSDEPPHARRAWLGVARPPGVLQGRVSRRVPPGEVGRGREAQRVRRQAQRHRLEVRTEDPQAARQGQEGRRPRHRAAHRDRRFGGRLRAREGVDRRERPRLYGPGVLVRQEQQGGQRAVPARLRGRSRRRHPGEARQRAQADAQRARPRQREVGVDAAGVLHRHERAGAAPVLPARPTRSADPRRRALPAAAQAQAHRRGVDRLHQRGRQRGQAVPGDLPGLPHAGHDDQAQRPRHRRQGYEQVRGPGVHVRAR